MGGDNVEMVRRAYEVFDTDLDALLLLLDRAIEWVSPSEALEPGIRHGHDGVRGAFAATAMAWDDPRHSAEDFYAADEDKVLATVNFRGHGRGSGMEADRTEFHLGRSAPAPWSAFEWFYCREAAMKAAVLGPGPGPGATAGLRRRARWWVSAPDLLRRPAAGLDDVVKGKAGRRWPPPLREPGPASRAPHGPPDWRRRPPLGAPSRCGQAAKRHRI